MDTIATHQHTILSHNSDINSLAFSQNLLLSGSSDKSVRLWSLNNFSQVAYSPLLSHKYAVRSVHFHPSGHQFVTASLDGKLFVWETATGIKVAEFSHPSSSGIRFCQFSASGQFLVSAGDDCLICVWDVNRKRLHKVLKGHEESVTTCCFTDDEGLLISGTTEGEIRIWDGFHGCGKQIDMKRGAHDLGVTCLMFSPNYRSAGCNNEKQSFTTYLLASCGYDNTIKLWDVTSKTSSTVIHSFSLRQTLSEHQSPVLTMAFSPGGDVIASGSSDKSILLWSVKYGSVLHKIEAHVRYVTSCVFSLDGNYLATGSNDKSIKIWRLTTENKVSVDLGHRPQDSTISDLPSMKNFTTGYTSWSVDDVCDWLKNMELSELSKTFNKHQIDGQELNSLSHESLLSVGVDALGHRNKLLRAVENLRKHLPQQSTSTLKLEDSAPDEYLCPITREIMKDPVIASDGYTYERIAIEEWMDCGHAVSPMTNARLVTSDLVSNRTLKMLIQGYLKT